MEKSEDVKRDRCQVVDWEVEGEVAGELESKAETKVERDGSEGGAAGEEQEEMKGQQPPSSGSLELIGPASPLRTREHTQTLCMPRSVPSIDPAVP